MRVAYARMRGSLRGLPKAGRIDVAFDRACTKVNSHIYPHCAVKRITQTYVAIQQQKKDDHSIIL